MISQLQQSLRSLKCYHMANALEEVVQISKENDLSYLECLNRLVEVELHNRKLNRIRIQFHRAGLPFEKLLEGFDFQYQTSISKRQVNGWLDFSWLDNRENKL
ncbi:MAG TPA: ATP-binding protein, partial [Rectinema sp.]|nr:ATP-binding protein [Rectinema sp.]